MPDDEEEAQLPDWLSRKRAALLIIGVSFLALVWVTRAWWHFIAYDLLYTNPQLIQYGIMAVAIQYGGWRYAKRYKEKKEEAYDGYSSWTPSDLREKITYFGSIGAGVYFFLAVVIVMPVIMMLFGFGPGFAAIYAHEDTADRMQASMEYPENMTEVDSEHPRVMPRYVADTITENSVSYRQYTVDSSAITYYDGKLQWSYAIEPNGMYNTLTLSQRGVYLQNMETYQRDASEFNSKMAYGMGENPASDWVWAVRNDRYWTSYHDAFNIPHDGENHIVASRVSHDWRIGNPLEGRLPIAYAVPKFTGTTIVDPDGNVEHFSPQESVENPVTKDQPFYPYSLARYEINSLEWIHGSINKAFHHEDQIGGVASVPGKNNRQPFTVPVTEPIDGNAPIVYRMAVEPWGGGSGIYQIYDFDSQLGSLAGIEVKKFNQTQYGPSTAPGYVKQSTPKASGGSWENYNVSEPVPVFIDGTLYWQVRVIPKSGQGITNVQFVNAETGEVIRFESIQTTQDIRTVQQFLASGQHENTTNTPDTGSDNQKTTEDGTVVTVYVLEDTDGDGKNEVVQNVTVSDGQTIQIDVGGNETANATG